ncbi:type VI secretion system baseplate subunit TssF [Phyllobacterium phragmitis]|uniref:Type VI secretion system baseplate subunit TssF n=1 Tax=Phyllobacterium phragmitis TaxID=2670329 RepID=A0A2S9IKU7_9HYPH|nr:type VI secretion system baseplate subunit TssF [Phyllobacterium phragmitis]PRD41149.1 type VI secretion system baseplate subunit TssF [Phyllobacterium phragmitis]
MAESFFHRYNEELSTIRRRAAGFAEAFPKIAGRLRMTGEVADDPHVERLIQSFAYSAARIRHKLDDEFPELTNGLLETLYPHYLAPIPSMSMVRLIPGKTLASVQAVPRHTEILAEPVAGEACRFRTTQDVEIAPIQISSASLSGQPIGAPPSPFSGAAGCLRISLMPHDEKKPLSQIGLKRLRLHLASQWRQASALYELLANHTMGIALAHHADDETPIFLPRENLRPVGFDQTESMLPYPPSSFIGYRLLTEFFALPQKFLFLDINGLECWRDDTLDIFIYLDETDRKLERAVSAGDLVLHATPVINLFRQSCEPTLLDGTRTEYRLLPDSRRQKTREIYSVERVLLTNRNGEEEICCPFFGRSLHGGATTTYWQIQRRFEADQGTSDIDITFVDAAHHAVRRLDAVASVDALCLNRDLPEKLPFGGGHPNLQIASGHDAVASIEPLIPPTPSVRMNDHEGRNWRLMSHLMLNHLSLFDNEGAALKDILSLYAFRDAPETQQLVNAIVRVEARASTARLGEGGMVPGTEILLEFDPAAIDRASAYLFGSVLDRFFGLYTSVNSFTRLIVALKGRSKPVATWPARAAEHPLL